MPDIRIKDLTTTASTTADDFFAADGATNGTRKLSAYSPTFGGNATVSGTLTVNSTADFLLKNGAWYSSAESSQRLLFSTSGTSYLKGHGAGQVVVLRNGSDSAAVTVYADLSTAFAGKVEATATTASTSTSTGALVVSGGVGVAGNTNIGGVASVGGSSNASVGVYVINTALTGADQYGVAAEPVWTSSATAGHTIWARTKTAASAFTLTNGQAFFVDQPTLGAGSSITNIYGMRVRNQGTTGVTNAYGLYVESQSGAATLNYAIYTAGGRINFQGLPTSSAGLPAGTLWNDSGTLKVA
jgi:hypothetical protein